MVAMLSSDEIRENMGELHDKCEALNVLAKEETRDLTEEEVTQFDAWMAEIDELETKHLPRAEKFEAQTAKLSASRTAPTAPIAPVRPVADHDDKERFVSERIEIPLKLRYRSGSLKAFKGRDREKGEKKAYVAGRFYAALLYGHEDSKKWCADHGIKAVMTGADNADGGVLVPIEVEQAIIDLRESYGVFRQKARRRPMGSDTRKVPRRTGGVTAYFVGEEDAVTASDKSWDSVSLATKTLGALVRYSNVLDEDTLIDMGDDLTSEIAYAFAVKEDACGFLGDATSTYGHMTGLITACAAATATIKTAATGNTAFSTLDLADFEGMVGLLPEYPGIQPEWYIHKSAWAASMMRLADAAGGNTAAIIEGERRREFLGYPVNITQTMNSTLTAQTSTNGLCYFGDLSMAASFGDRRGVRIQLTADRYFEYQQIGILGSERFDIVVHDVGDTSNAGAMVMLATPSS